MGSKIGIILVVLFSVISGRSFAEGLPELKGVQTAETAEGFRLTFDFTDVVTTESVSVDFKGEAIIVDVPNVLVNKKIKSKVDSSIVKSISAEEINGGMSGAIIYRGIKASEFKDGISVETQGSQLTVIVQNPPHIVAKLPEKTVAVSRSLPVVPPSNMTAADKATEAMSLENAAATESTTKTAEADPNISTVAESEIAVKPAAETSAATAENEIPVLESKGKNEGAASGSSMQKVLLTVIALAIFGGGAIIFIRRHAMKVNKESPLMQIKVISQYHLAPKKTLAVVRVAGESLLIGITDNNISMLKSLALLDEDIPEVTENDFKKLISSGKGNSVLSDQEVNEEFSFGGVKEQVTSRVKGLRSII